MELYYKVEKDSVTGKAFMNIHERELRFREKAQEVMAKYGIKKMYRIGWDLCGVHTCVFDTPPNREDWKRVDDGYMPKARCKNVELVEDFKELHGLTIKRVEIDKLFNHKNPFFQVGYEIFDDCIVFISDEDNKLNNGDAKIISNMTYLKMKNNK